MILNFHFNSTYLVELHLDDALEVLLVVEVEFLLTKLVYKYQRKFTENYDD